MKRLLVCLLLLSPALVHAQTRLNYRAVTGALADGRVAWRAWTEAGVPHLLVTDPSTLEVSVVEQAAETLLPREPAHTAWDRWREAAAARKQPLQNAGVRKARPEREGAWLTFDLCPSRHPLDRGVFTDLEADEKPLPVFLEVSGRWLQTHPDDWSWLVAERDAGRLDITWVNHSEHHRYLPGTPLDQNFFLLPDTNVKAEVFAVEQRLLDRGELPSVFFRFPGLVSSASLVDEVLALGLIPLGSSAWLAKQQRVNSGALVLIHANGNEPEGETLLEGWDHGHRADLATGQWHWLGLADFARASN